MNYVPNLIKVAIIVLSLAMIPVVYHIPMSSQYSICHPRQRFAYHDFTTAHLFPNLDSFISTSNTHTIQRSKDIHKTKPLNASKPTTKMLARVMEVLMENESLIRETLKLKTNLNHVRLSLCLECLKQKGFIEYIVIDNKTSVTLTKAGREFAKPLVSLYA